MGFVPCAFDRCQDVGCARTASLTTCIDVTPIVQDLVDLLVLPNKVGPADTDRRKRSAIWMSSSGSIVLLCLTSSDGWQRLPGAVETHGSVERWAAFVVGFLLTTAALLVIF